MKNNQVGETVTEAGVRSINASLAGIAEDHVIVTSDVDRGIALIQDDHGERFLLAAQRTQHGMAWQCYAQFVAGEEAESLTAYNKFIRKTVGTKIAFRMIELGLPKKDKEKPGKSKQKPEGTKVVTMGT